MSVSFSSTIRFGCLVSGIAIVAACSPGRPINKEKIDQAQYWQRVHTSDAVYQRGPKAQQMLARDISRCVTELQELERLGMLKHPVPADTFSTKADPDKRHLEGWEAPGRDEYLYAEVGDYYDMESCMLAKGWERVMYVPYDVSREARDVYVGTHKRYKYQTKYEENVEGNKKPFNE